MIRAYRLTGLRPTLSEEEPPAIVMQADEVTDFLEEQADRVEDLAQIYPGFEIGFTIETVDMTEAEWYGTGEPFNAKVDGETYEPDPDGVVRVPPLGPKRTNVL